jgi:predicted TIM-barrel fold metal-dependent hydrolase
MFYPIIREFPMVNFVIAHFGIQTGGNYSFETFWMAMDTPNVYVESGWCFQARIAEFAKELPRNKLVFGTDSPPNEPGMWLRELEMLCRPAPHGIDLERTRWKTTWATTLRVWWALKPHLRQKARRRKGPSERHLRRRRKKEAMTFAAAK